MIVFPIEIFIIGGIFHMLWERQRVNDININNDRNSMEYSSSNMNSTVLQLWQ